ncbi:zinc ribbon domain-containing protein [Paractinoplanes hotanensis]|uniref:Zinc ribbon domain-containing protein n=1 Tax=Paractinoplanes hotanensis TaxID=2906497 RepID=A0ABT0Y483_9ACTN|nr:zinc ribbon domain-containing protein [Actinoplanes hotanensis]MCM4080864.1 zinc ribbon domain-containing protein [Actinoplanes hotanensis]
MIVYARTGLHCNSIDAAITKRSPQRWRHPISIMDYTEDSAIGDLVATVLDGVKEYQSRAAGADIAYKMGQKIARGVPVGRAPIGYLNVRETFEGREVRTVAVDPVSGPLARMAFEAVSQRRRRLPRDHLGPHRRGSPHEAHSPLPHRPAHLDQLARLTPARPLLPRPGPIMRPAVSGQARAADAADVFDRVRHMLESRRAGDARERTLNSYLKGAVWCARCQRRLMIIRGKSKAGALHFYYICRSRQLYSADLPYLPIAKMETAVLDIYATVAVPADLRTPITTLGSDDRFLLFDRRSWPAAGPDHDKAKIGVGAR